MRLDLANDAGGDDLIEAQRAADGEHALALLHRGSARPGPIQRRGRSVRKSSNVHRQQRDILLRIGGNQLGRDLVCAIKLHSQILRITHDVLIGQDEPLRVDEKSCAVPRFAPYSYDRVLQPLEVLREVIAGGLCCGRGSRNFLHFGVVIGEVNVLLAARKRYLNVPRKALASQFGGLL